MPHKSNQVRPAILALLGTIMVGACFCGSEETRPRQRASPVVSREAPSSSAVASIEPQVVTYASRDGELLGFLYKPPGEGPFPAVVYSHGSEPHPANMRGQAKFFVPHGFVLFVPHRRGHGRSAEAGAYFQDVWMENGRDPAHLVELIEASVDDVQEAVSYVRALPYVDGRRVSLSGCSVGGILSLLGSQRLSGIHAAVNFSGGAMMWRSNAPLRERMRLAASQAKAPVFYVQASNDFDTAPTLELSALMESQGLPVRHKIFSAKGKTAREGHSFCAGGTSPRWGEDVLRFLRHPSP